MKFLRIKYVLIGALIIFFCIIGLMQFTRTFFYIAVTKNLVQLKFHNPLKNTSQMSVISQNTNTKQIMYNGKLYNVVKQSKVSKYKFSSQSMNISFIYTDNIKYKQITPEIVALNNSDVKNTDNNTLYMYSTTVPANYNSFKIPFTLPGPMKQSKIIKTQNFIANQEIYGDGKNSITLLVLRQNQQTIVIRIPPDSSHVSGLINDILGSIQVLQ